MKRPLVTLFFMFLAGIMLASAGRQASVIGIMVMTVLPPVFAVLIKKGVVRVEKYVLPRAYLGFAVFLVLIPVLFVLGVIRRTHYDAVTEAERKPYLELWDRGELEVIAEGRIRRISTSAGKYEIHLTDCVIRSAYGSDVSKAGGCIIYAGVDSISVRPAAPRAGNRVRVYGKMKPYLHAANPGQFDAAEYHLSDREYAYISAKKVWITERHTNVFTEIIFAASGKMKETLSVLYDSEQAGILTAMLTGDKSLMEDETKDLYKSAGISHILAVSGLHVSFFCMGLYRLLMRMKAGAKASRIAALIALVLFVIYTGAGTSALRAGIMTSVLLLSKSVRKRYDMLSALALAGIVLLAVFPHDIGNAAFVLSFSAVPGIYAANELKLKRLSGAVITLTTLPGVLFFYYETSVYGVLINILVIPLTFFVLVFGFVSAILGMLFIPLGGLAAGTVCILLKIIGIAAKLVGYLPFSYVCTGKPTVAGIAIYVILLIIAYRIAVSHVRGEELFFTRVYTCRILLVILAVIFLVSGSKPDSLAFLSVGQGDSFVYLNDGSCTVVDCGSSDTGSVGKYILSPYLKYNGETIIDACIVTHTDDDHINGIAEILEAMPAFKGSLRFYALYDGNVAIKRLIMPKVSVPGEAYKKLVDLAAEKNVEVVYAEAGYSESFPATLTCLAPKDAVESENGTSLVFLLETEKYDVFLMGDADAAEEAQVMQYMKLLKTRGTMASQKQEAATSTSHGSAVSASLTAASLSSLNKKVILKAGHHGSRTSTSEEFLRFIHPDIAVISCGYNNRYGHPHSEVVDLLRNFEIIVYRTDQDGALIIRQ
jgi:competence protein ComEC